MTTRTIVYTPDPVLRRKAHKVTVFDKEFKTLVDDMVETLREAPGVGLAAPQIGLSMRLVVVEYGDDDEDEEKTPKKLYVVANPEFVKLSEEKVEGVEACLSVPNLCGTVDRHQEVMIKGFNKNGQPIKIKANGWLARIFQHEIDHLDGILFTDRANRVWQPGEGEAEAADV